MALFRNVNMSFWTDTKVTDDYTPEDKYFMLYALTNPYTNIIGCYEISIKQMSNDLGYTKDVIENLLKRFSTVHKTVFYNFDTKELFVRNWSKYNWSNSPKLDPALLKAFEKVKCDEFYDELVDIYNARETAEEKIPYRYGIKKNLYPIDITNSNSIPISISNAISISNTIPISSAIANASKSEVVDKDEALINQVVSYLNERVGTNYKASTKSTQKHIKARIKEGYTFEHFQTVIENKIADWQKDKEMSKYLRPETLFGNKFESYLNQPRRVLTTADIQVDMSDVRKVMWND